MGADETEDLIRRIERKEVGEDRKAVDGEKYADIPLGMTSGHIVKMALAMYTSEITRQVICETNKERRDQLANMAYESLLLSYAIEHDLNVCGVRTSPLNHGNIQKILAEVKSKEIIKQQLAKEAGENIANSPVVEEIDVDFFDKFSKSTQGKKFEALRQELKNAFPEAEDFDTNDAHGIIVDLSDNNDAAKMVNELKKFVSVKKPAFDN